MKVSHLFTVFLLALSICAAHAAEPNRYTNPEVGLLLEKPAAWHFMSAQTVIENRDRVRFKDEELREMVKQRARQPLVVIAKYADPASRAEVTPTIQVTLSPLAKASEIPPEKILEQVVQPMQRGFADFRFEKPVQPAKVAGLPAAHTVATYSLGNAEGKTFGVRARLWLAPRGDFVFLVGMSGPQAGPDVSEEEFAAVLQSIGIER